MDNDNEKKEPILNQPIAVEVRSQKDQRNKFTTFFSLAVALVFIAVFFYFNYKPRPYSVISPDSYDDGTTVSLYKDLPPDFPQSLILEQVDLDYSGAVKMPDGKVKNTVSYISNKKSDEIGDMYRSSFPKDGWDFVRSDRNPGLVYIVEAAKDDESLIVTAAYLDDFRTMVTLQHDK